MIAQKASNASIVNMIKNTHRKSRAPSLNKAAFGAILKESSLDKNFSTRFKGSLLVQYDLVGDEWIFKETSAVLKDYFEEEFLNEIKTEKKILIDLYNLFSKNDLSSRISQLTAGDLTPRRLQSNSNVSNQKMLGNQLMTLL